MFYFLNAKCQQTALAGPDDQVMPVYTESKASIDQPALSDGEDETF